MEKEFNIEDIFDDVPDRDIPNNRPREIIDQQLHTIIVNGNCLNYFEVLFPYDDNISHIEVLYRQMERLYLVKRPSYIYKKCNSFIIEVSLSPEETKMFGDTLLDTKAQVRLTYLDRVIYTDMFDVKIVETLKEERLY